MHAIKKTWRIAAFYLSLAAVCLLTSCSRSRHPVISSDPVADLVVYEMIRAGSGAEGPEVTFEFRRYTYYIDEHGEKRERVASFHHQGGIDWGPWARPGLALNLSQMIIGDRFDPDVAFELVGPFVVDVLFAVEEDRWDITGAELDRFAQDYSSRM